MQWKTLSDRAGERTSAIVLETGDEVLTSLQSYARRFHLGGSRFTALGAFERAVLGFFDWERKDYRRIPIDEQMEVVSLVGDIGVDADEARPDPTLHAHVVVALSDGTARGGHLLEAHVRPTLEIVLVESPAHLTRRLDPATGLRLLRFD